MNMNGYGYAYSRMEMEMEDPEETKHRKAQFLIYKSMEKADHIMRKSQRPSWLRVRMFKLKIKLGKNIKRLKKSLLAANRSGIRLGVLQQWKRLFAVRQAILKPPTAFS